MCACFGIEISTFKLLRHKDMNYPYLYWLCFFQYPMLKLPDEFFKVLHAPCWGKWCTQAAFKIQPSEAIIPSALGSWCAIKMQPSQRKCNQGKYVQYALSHSTQQFRKRSGTTILNKVIQYNNLQRKKTSGRANMHKNNDYAKAGKHRYTLNRI